jgi:hypothetical protein
MRVHPAYAIVLLIAIAMAAQPAMAFTQMAIPFVTSCDVIFMGPMEFADTTISEFNSVYIADTSLETLDIDFPAFALGVGLSPLVASGTMAIDRASGPGVASFNVLPFGPVSLAFPSIEQTADETHTYQRTYFFSDIGI